MGKYKIIIQRSTPAVNEKYDRTESIYEQSTDNEINLMDIIMAFNKPKDESPKKAEGEL